MKAVNGENNITKDKNILLVLQDKSTIDTEINCLIENFCGKVVFGHDEILTDDNRIFVCGDFSHLRADVKHLHIIEEFSSNYEEFRANATMVGLGQVPILIHHAGVFYRRLFEGDDIFNEIKSAHTFQELTESTKESKSFRKGIYLTEIRKESGENDDALHFRLLRCSSNLGGPTDNFRSADHNIVNRLNEGVKYDFELEIKLNHVLAQIYENKKSDNQKEVKAKIKAHSDKTKDMPKQGLIAFCTFYDMSVASQLKPSKTDRFDWCYKETSALTTLHFKLKKTAAVEGLVKEFAVPLYPNSVFVIPLSTNRLYTHEIRPSVLNVDRIPTRMGYVVRCSEMEAVFMDKQTFLKENGKLIKLEPMTQEMQVNLRDSYYQENTSEQLVDYGKIHFSMNAGDYQKPIF